MNVDPNESLVIPDITQIAHFDVAYDPSYKTEINDNTDDAKESTVEDDKENEKEIKCCIIL